MTRRPSFHRKALPERRLRIHGDRFGVSADGERTRAMLASMWRDDSSTPDTAVRRPTQVTRLTVSIPFVGVPEQ